MTAEESPSQTGAALPRHRLSLVVPVYNEEDSVRALVEGIHSALADYRNPWELIIVDDGSRDSTAAAARAARQHYGDHVRVLSLQRNFGQTAAMQAGIDHAHGDVICSLDGDLQNDPADIPRMVDRLLRENLDLLVGWRHNRQDGRLRSFLSRVANSLIGWITGVPLHDYGCSLKVYRGYVIRQIRLYGEMHRFIPAWVAVATHPSRIAEEEVNHNARETGTSKYGFSRIWRVLIDLFAVYFFIRYRARPGHFFGSIGLGMGLLGGLVLMYLTLLKLFTGADIGDRPLLLLGILLIVVGIQLLTTGVLAEMATRTYYESTQASPYMIRSADSGPQAMMVDETQPQEATAASVTESGRE